MTNSFQKKSGFLTYSKLTDFALNVTNGSGCTEAQPRQAKCSQNYDAHSIPLFPIFDLIWRNGTSHV